VLNTHQTALESRTDLERYGKNALVLFSLELRFQIEDIHTVAADALTEGNNDKKCDLIYVDREDGYIIVAQSYVCLDTTRRAAPSNKASDLNTGASWLLSRPLRELPTELQPAAQEVRDALRSNEIRHLQFWYVHNLPESHNVRDELRTVEQTVRNALLAEHLAPEGLEIRAIEVGSTTLEEWYQAVQTPILVTDEFNIPVPGGYVISENDWEALVTAVPASWLHSVFARFGSKLFSANVRDYLGSRRSALNINNGIKETARDDPGHFWVYNNGLTALVHRFEMKEVGEANKQQMLTIKGISIVNGAQTTGALGNLDNAPTGEAMVPARFVKCSNRSTIQKIIEYNNRQNQVEASDFRSNDAIQRRLRAEFEHIPDARYLGGRRGGYEDVIRRQSDLIPSDTAAQALAAFYQDPVVAYNQKSQIWRSDNLYSRYFTEQTHAEHIVFVYSLLRCIEDRKVSLMAQSNSGPSLTGSLEQQLTFFRQRGSTFLLVSAIARCLETIAGQAIPNPRRVSFGSNVSPLRAQRFWTPIVEATVPFSNHLLPAVKNGLKSESIAPAVDTFISLVEATKSANAPVFQTFTQHLRFRT
jgi:hypothetical protein